MTYQIIITEETSANIVIDNNTTNVSITTNEYPITIEYNAVIEQAGGNAYGNANVAAYLASSSLTGNIITSANISGAYILGNGSQLTGLPATYGNANVAANLAAFGSNPISTSGNITAGYILGNGSQLTGMYSNANVQAYLPTYSGNIGELTITGNLTVTGTTSTVNTEIVNVSESVVGNVDAGNLRTAGQVTATGNITGGNIVSAGQGNIDNILTDAVTFDTAAAEATAAAKLNWSSAYGTMAHGLGDGSLLLDGMDLVIYATNGEANTLSKGEVVYISGAVGDRAEIRRAAATSDALSATTIGVVKGDIASGATGYVTTQGVVDGLSLGAFTAGQVVWLSTTPGQFTATQPSAPTHTVFVGVVERANAGNGRLLVRVNNGWELGELHDVKITTPADNQYLKYSTGAGNIWVNAGLDIADDTTPSLGGDLATGAYNISGTGNVTAGNFIGSGQFLSSLAGANVTGTVANATYATSAGSATTAGTVTNAAQANITSVGTLTSLSVSGNVDAGNLRTAGQVTATGNISGGNVFVPLGGRYYGDFTTGTASGRTAFQTTATGTSAATSLTAIPGPNHVVSNTAFSSQLNLFASADVGNSSFSRLQQLGNLLLIGTSSTGTGVAGNLRLTAGSSSLNMLTTGNVGISNTAPQHNLSVGSSAYIGTNLSVAGNITTGGFGASNVNVDNLNSFSTGNISLGTNLFVSNDVVSLGNVSAVNYITASSLSGNVLNISNRITANSYVENLFGFGNATGTITPDLANGSIQTLTLTGNITLNSLANVITGSSATLILTQDGTGNRTLTSTWKFAGNSRTLSTAANAIDIISVFYNGSNYYASLTTGYA